MSNSHPRIARERTTVETMIGFYCHEQHGIGHGLCEQCETLQDYARQRLQKCPFQEGKTTCAKCPVHCYRPEMRERIRSVMRYAGPRMLFRHPILAIQHMADGRRNEPFYPSRANTDRADVPKQGKP
jgi:hypothetical protein